jgi:hypothetical protein
MTRSYMSFCSSNPIGQEGIASLACLAQLQLLNPTAYTASHWKAAIGLWYKYAHYKSFMSSLNQKASCFLRKRIFKRWLEILSKQYSQDGKKCKALAFDKNRIMTQAFTRWQYMTSSWVKKSQNQTPCPICAESHSW